MTLPEMTIVDDLALLRHICAIIDCRKIHQLLADTLRLRIVFATDCNHVTDMQGECAAWLCAAVQKTHPEEVRFTLKVQRKRMVM